MLSGGGGCFDKLSTNGGAVLGAGFLDSGIRRNDGAWGRGRRCPRVQVYCRSAMMEDLKRAQ